MQFLHQEFEGRSDTVKEKQQTGISDVILTLAVDQFKQLFGRSFPEESDEEKSKRWSTFNDFQQKMIFGTYNDSRLPSCFRAEIYGPGMSPLEIVFHSECAIFHNHVKLKEPKKLQQNGIYSLTRKIKILNKDSFRAIVLAVAIPAHAMFSPRAIATRRQPQMPLQHGAALSGVGWKGKSGARAARDMLAPRS